MSESLEPMERIKCLEDHIVAKARKQAEQEWDDLLVHMQRWTEEKPTDDFRFVIHGGTPYRQLSFSERGTRCPDDLKKVAGGLTNSMVTLRSHWVAARVRHLAASMAQNLIEKAELIP